MVDVEHKYFHKISIKSPEIFETILEKNVPTKYFMKIESLEILILKGSASLDVSKVPLNFGSTFFLNPTS